MQTILNTITNLSNPAPVVAKPKTEMQQILTLLTAQAGGSKNAGPGGGGSNNRNNRNNNHNTNNNNHNGGRRVSVKPNIRYKFYCWSHGVNPSHNSCSCTNKFPGHQNATVYTNQMVGWTTNAPRWCGFVTPWDGGGRSESNIEKSTNTIAKINTYTPSSSQTNILNPTWIKIGQTRSPPPSYSIATITTPSIPVATANQFACFNHDNDDEACADSGATINIVKDEVVLNHEVITPNGPSVISATINIMKASARGELSIPLLPAKAKIAHKMPVAQNLLSLSVLANNNMISILDKKKITIYKEDSVRITVMEPPVMKGKRAPNSLWKVPTVQKSLPRIDLDTLYHPKIAHNAVSLYKDKSLWDIPLPTSTWAPPEQQRIQEQQCTPQVSCALSAYTQPTLEALAIYLHSCASWPVAETWCNAIAKGNYSSWPHLSKCIGLAWVRKHVPTSKQTTMGHMKAIRSNTRPTTSLQQRRRIIMKRKVQKMKMMDPSQY